ncbi:MULTISPECIES: integrase core domain-containing protein [Pacificibacter]|uniref:integrase core domain-containing protein n=1 Tax=Pacificibacter TaxID=1042323 RepID=UPI001C096168|nr:MULTISPECIES: integrase core domain-containing protein [Pacificibacter]MBU2934629.1 integrase core domain-containing protein [Pacificibacter marinus]MDO6616474.1 IS481 family transposase [Pacificibacter sp. 1_MG-2023]
MTNEERDIQRKLRVLQHAEKIGNVRKACRYFGIGRSSFYRWRDAYQKHGEAGLKNAKSIPKNPANQTPAEIVEKVLYLRRKYHLGPIRIVWYLARYHGIKISDAGVYRILKRNGLNRLPRGTRMRKLHTKRYHKQVPGHHIQVDVKFLTLKGKCGEKVPFLIREVRTDNGHEFQAKFHWHVEDLGFRHAYIKRGTPQLNGKVERSHRSDQQEFYQLLSYKGDVDLEAKLDEWERFYNFARPHGAHNGQTPYEALRDKLQ